MAGGYPYGYPFQKVFTKIILPTIQNRGEGKNTPLGKSANNPLDRSRVKVDSCGWVRGVLRLEYQRQASRKYRSKRLVNSERFWDLIFDLIRKGHDLPAMSIAVDVPKRTL